MGLSCVMPSVAVPQKSERWHGRLNPIVAAVLVILVSYSGPYLIVQEAARNAGLSDELTGSWIFTLAFGSGLAGLTLSLWLRQPIIVAFSTAGSVLLSSSLKDYEFSDAIGAYLFVGLGCLAIGLSSTFSRLMARIPGPIVSAMLVGVLFRFGMGYFSALPGSPAGWQRTALVASMGIVYFVSRSRGSRLAVLWTCAAGIAATFVLGLQQSESVALSLVDPQFTRPTFDFGAMIGLGLPLLAIALSAQYAPGYGVLKEAGYEPPMNAILSVTGAIGAGLAAFGCPGINLAAITAGFATGPDAHPDSERRYIAGIYTGLLSMGVGLLGLSALSLFALMPGEFVAAVTGLGLFGTIAVSGAGAFADPAERDAAVATMLCAAAGFTLFGVAAPFWALVIGLAISGLGRRQTGAAIRTPATRGTGPRAD